MRARSWIARTVMVAVIVGGFGAVASEAATAVGTAFTYQGRLEDGQTPANGTYDLEFRLYDAASAGSQHGPTVTASAVPVADGWVTVELDFGNEYSGDARWLEISVRPTGGGSWVTLTPRRELTPTPHAIRAEEAYHADTADLAANAQQLGGQPAGDFIDTSSSVQIKEGRLVVGAASGSGSSYGIEAYGADGGGLFASQSGYSVVLLGQTTSGLGVDAQGTATGGHFTSASGDGEVYLAGGSYGVHAEGYYEGGRFTQTTGGATAYLGYLQRGVQASGPEMGGRFNDSNDSGTADIAVGDWGIQAEGNGGGGEFAESDGSGIAWLGVDDRGVWALGSDAGGYFRDEDDTGTAYVGYGDRGIDATGSEMGGRFADSDGSGYVEAGSGDYGIRAFGNTAGGRFEESDGSGHAYLAWEDYGIHAYASTAGALFEVLDASGYAYVAYGDRGIEAIGSETGGYFEDRDNSGYAYAGWSDLGLRGFGDAAGGYFQDLTSSSYAYVGYGSYKIQGSGTVSFVQNHPYDDEKVVVYHAPEASEVAVYTRGSSRLEGGRAVIALDPTFALVANPDLGLTAHLTARAPAADLHVVSASTDELVVEGIGDAVFDYMVWGLRIGFEESAPVQVKEREAYIPSMDDHRELYAAEPSLRGFNAFERFAASERELEGLPKNAALDLGNAQALKEAVHEFDPAVDSVSELEDRPDRPDRDGPGAGRSLEKGTKRTPDRAALGDREGRPADRLVRQEPSTASLIDADGDLETRSLRTERAELAVELPAVAGIAPGEVVAVDPDSGLLVPAASSGDLRVVGIAADDPGVVLGTGADGDSIRARVVLSGLAICRVDAGYGDILPGDLLTASPTPGHAMRAGGEPLPGSVVAKALEPFADGQGTISVLVWLR